MNSKQTGLDFENKLTPDTAFNMFNYMYFYNGAGVGAGDFNNDGLIDLFFSANQGDNRLFINEGKLHFRDVTEQAAIFQNRGWSTGVSIVDINNDGLLDIYICQVGNFEKLHGKNQLLICKGIKNGIPYYTDEARKYNLDFSGFSTQAAFFDYDADGDLDMFLLNHSVHQSGTFAPRRNFLGSYHPLSGDRLFRNDGEPVSLPSGERSGGFTDVTKESAINSSAISYGLGVVIADINLDGWPDLYTGNDFHENDYLYINQKNGTFTDESSSRMMHTSLYSMGVDAGDINNDGYPDIVSMDMLPSDPDMIRRSLSDGDYDIHNYKISIGYSHQYSRNNLQLNRRNGMFSETGLYAGVSATDWSWAPLWVDFDNDGWKDLFVSNGIPKRLNDIDYVNFFSDREIQNKLINDKVEDKDLRLMNKFPEIKLFNNFFLNQQDASFKDISTFIKGDVPSFSNGAVYADLDNDGDLDIVTNNVDEQPLVYKNETSGQTTNHFIDLALHGPKKNINALGTKVFIFSRGSIKQYENYPVRGFQSSMQIPMHIGLDSTGIDSVFLVWPDNTYQSLPFSKRDMLQKVTYQENLPAFNYSIITSYFQNQSRSFKDIADEARLFYKHQENPFLEFTREPLLPHMVSTEGPALAIGDINRDGTDDLFIGSSKTFKPAVFLQQKNGVYLKLEQPDLDKDSLNEEVGACWADINNDNYLDLIVANGGNEYFGKSSQLMPCVYLNDGRGGLQKLANAFDSIYVNASCVQVYDFNNDGFTDLFIGGRSIPWEYGAIPRSYLLQNDKHGHFIDVTNDLSGELSTVGMVTDAAWFDMDKDGDKDLLVTCEWGGIVVFMNDKGMFKKKVLTKFSGWWNFLLPADIDNDGDIDLIAGNLGLNNRLKASPTEPVRLYYNDFDNNGKKEQIVTYYLQGKEIPFFGKAELEKVIPTLKKKYIYAEDFAKASLANIFSSGKLSTAEMLKADYFANAILINDGKMNFDVKAMPWEAQLTSFRSAAIFDANNDTLPDILLMGNYYDNNFQFGRSDADFGTILINKGNGNFKSEMLKGVVINGQVRHMEKTNLNGKEAFILAMNNDSLRIISFK